MHYSEVNRLVEQIRLVNLSDTWSVLSREAFTRRRAKDGQVRWRRSVSRQYVQAWRVLAACCRAALEVRLELEQRRMAAGFLRWRHGVVRELMLNSKRARERLAAAHSRLQQGWARWWSMATLVHLRHERRCGAGVTYALLLEHAAMRRFARAWRARTVAAWRRRDEELAVIRKWQRIGLSKRRMAVWRAQLQLTCAQRALGAKGAVRLRLRRLWRGWRRWGGIPALAHLRGERRSSAHRSSVTYAAVVKRASLRRFTRAWRVGALLARWRRERAAVADSVWRRLACRAPFRRWCGEASARGYFTTHGTKARSVCLRLATGKWRERTANELTVPKPAAIQRYVLHASLQRSLTALRVRATAAQRTQSAWRVLRREREKRLLQRWPAYVQWGRLRASLNARLVAHLRSRAISAWRHHASLSLKSEQEDRQRRGTILVRRLRTRRGLSSWFGQTSTRLALYQRRAGMLRVGVAHAALRRFTRGWRCAAIKVASSKLLHAIAARAWAVSLQRILWVRWLTAASRLRLMQRRSARQISLKLRRWMGEWRERSQWRRALQMLSWRAAEVAGSRQSLRAWSRWGEIPALVHLRNERRSSAHRGSVTYAAVVKRASLRRFTRAWRVGALLARWRRERAAVERLQFQTMGLRVWGRHADARRHSRNGCTSAATSLGRRRLEREWRRWILRLDDCFLTSQRSQQACTRRQAAILRGANALHRATKRGWLLCWCSYVRASRLESGVRATAGLHSRTRGMLSSWRKWARLAHWKQELVAVVARIDRSSQLRFMVVSLHAWLGAARSSMLRSLRHIFNRRSFAHWTQQMRLMRLRLSLHATAIAHWRHAAPAAALDTWVVSSVRRQRLHASLHASLRQKQTAQASRALHGWLAQLRQLRARQRRRVLLSRDARRAVLRKVFRRIRCVGARRRSRAWLQRRAAAAFEAGWSQRALERWERYARSCVVAKGRRRRSIAVMAVALTTRGWAHWVRAAALPLVAHERRLRQQLRMRSSANVLHVMVLRAASGAWREYLAAARRQLARVALAGRLRRRLGALGAWRRWSVVTWTRRCAVNGARHHRRGKLLDWNAVLHHERAWRAREAKGAARLRHCSLRSSWRRWGEGAELVHLRNERRSSAHRGSVTYAAVVKRASLRRFTRAWRVGALLARWRRERAAVADSVWRRLACRAPFRRWCGEAWARGCLARGTSHGAKLRLSEWRQRAQLSLLLQLRATRGARALATTRSSRGWGTWAAMAERWSEGAALELAGRAGYRTTNLVRGLRGLVDQGVVLGARCVPLNKLAAWGFVRIAPRSVWLVWQRCTRRRRRAAAARVKMAYHRALQCARLWCEIASGRQRLIRRANAHRSMVLAARRQGSLMIVLQTWGFRTIETHTHSAIALLGLRAQRASCATRCVSTWVAACLVSCGGRHLARRRVVRLAQHRLGSVRRGWRQWARLAARRRRADGRLDWLRLGVRLQTVRRGLHKWHAHAAPLRERREWLMRARVLVAYYRALGAIATWKEHRLQARRQDAETKRQLLAQWQQARAAAKQAAEEDRESLHRQQLRERQLRQQLLSRAGHGLLSWYYAYQLRATLALRNAVENAMLQKHLRGGLARAVATVTRLRLQSRVDSWHAAYEKRRAWRAQQQQAMQEWSQGAPRRLLVFWRAALLRSRLHAAQSRRAFATLKPFTKRLRRALDVLKSDFLRAVRMALAPMPLLRRSLGRRFLCWGRAARRRAAVGLSERAYGKMVRLCVTLPTLRRAIEVWLGRIPLGQVAIRYAQLELSKRRARRHVARWRAHCHGCRVAAACRARCRQALAEDRAAADGRLRELRAEMDAQIAGRDAQLEQLKGVMAATLRAQQQQFDRLAADMRRYYEQLIDDLRRKYESGR